MGENVLDGEYRKGLCASCRHEESLVFIVLDKTARRVTISRQGRSYGTWLLLVRHARL